MSETTEGTTPKHVVFVGDANCGKKELALRWRSFLQGVTRQEDLDDMTGSFEIFMNEKEKKSYELTFHETTGQEGYSHLRAMAYDNCDALVACFNSTESLRHCLDVRRERERERDFIFFLFLLVFQLDVKTNIIFFFLSSLSFHILTPRHVFFYVFLIFKVVDSGSDRVLANSPTWSPGKKSPPHLPCDV
jgi:hypothetical protein